MLGIIDLMLKISKASWKVSSWLVDTLLAPLLNRAAVNIADKIDGRAKEEDEIEVYVPEQKSKTNAD